ncbi:MAG: transcription termination/antitermination protein NusA [Ruminococcus sp.]|nr:transcription termination/antitermination protein NusA [Ruminococcus sp.]
MDNKELFDALKLLEAEKGISVDTMISQISRAIVVACKNNFGGNDDVDIEMDPEWDVFRVSLNKTVVEEVFDPDYEISLEDARKIDKKAEIDGKVGIPLDPKNLGRIAVQTARSVIRQGIRDGEKGQMLAEFQSRQQEIVTAKVERIDPNSGAATIVIGKAETILPKSEQVGETDLKEGDHVKVYIVDVKNTEKGPRAIISRTHPDFVKRLFEAEVPEIFEGTVQIKSVSREAGSRTKLAVYSDIPGVDAVGSCIGAKGVRVNSVVDELGGEKIDIVLWSENPVEFIAAALSPATVKSVVPANDGTKVCRVTVPDNQLSLAIGNKGQNARLAARLTGWKIDIRPVSGFYGEEDDDERFKPLDDAEDAETAEIAETAEDTATAEVATDEVAVDVEDDDENSVVQDETAESDEASEVAEEVAQDDEASEETEEVAQDDETSEETEEEE